MASKVAEMNTKKKVITTSSITREEKNNKPPAGATIIEQDIRVETEQIENGYLTTKSYNGRYKEKDSKDSYGNYFNYSKKWFSEEDPLTITVNDKSLSEAFED